MKRLGSDLTSAQKEMKTKHKAYENAVGILSRRLQGGPRSQGGRGRPGDELSQLSGGSHRRQRPHLACGWLVLLRPLAETCVGGSVYRQLSSETLLEGLEKQCGASVWAVFSQIPHGDEMTRDPDERNECPCSLQSSSASVLWGTRLCK